MVAALLLVLLAAAALRGVRLDQPGRLTFDEKHYVTDAREIASRGVEVDRPAHPPGGKLAIGASMALLGDRPVGWRAPAAVAGVGAVAATFAMGRRLLRSWWAGLVAAGLVAVDGVAVTMSRIGMLDGIQAGLVAAGALCNLLDWRTSDRRWRWATGALLGAGVAVKWSTAPVLLVAVVVALAADAGPRPGVRAVVRAARRTLVPLVLVPAALYVASYAGWFAHVDRSETGRERCPAAGCSITDTVSGWGFEQWDMWALQGRLETSHPDRSRPWAWLTVTDPVLTYAESCPTGRAVEARCEVPPGRSARALTIGNPALWWTALLAGPYLLVKAVVRRHAASAFVLAYGSALIVPWFFTSNPGFAFYLAPAVPFVALAVASALRDLVRATRWGGAMAVALVVAAAVGWAVWLYPVWTGWPLSPPALDARLVLDAWR